MKIKVARVIRRLLAPKLASPSADFPGDPSFMENPKSYATEVPISRYELMRRAPSGSW